jgi:hypothetical protein
VVRQKSSLLKCNHFPIAFPLSSQPEILQGIRGQARGIRKNQSEKIAGILQKKLMWWREYRYFKNAFLSEAKVKRLTRKQKERLIGEGLQG